MAFLDILGSTILQVGGGLLANELQRKQQRRAAKVALQTPQGIQGNGVGAGGQFPRVGQPSITRTGPQGGRMSVAIPSGLSNREFKTAMCRAVRERLVHPAQATAELKMRGMKGCTRRLNPLNPRALTRALRRLEGFQRTVKRVQRALPTKTRTRKASKGHHHHPAAGG